MFRSLGLLITVLVTATACASGAPAADDGARQLAQPVTVEHRFGTTTVDSVPQRIVTIDLQWTDVMLAMGVEPVGYTQDSRMPDRRVPWQQLPSGAKALSLDDGVPVEEILALDPDLIVGSFSITDEETFRLLSAAAPTIAGPKNADEVIPWQDLVRTAGRILDRPDKAEQLVGGVEGQIAGLGGELPQLQGKTYALAQYIVGDSMTIVANPEDGAGLLFAGLGMTLYPPLLDEGRRTGSTRVNVSTERADLLRADYLAFLVNGGDESDLADIPGFGQLPGSVAVLDYPTIVGINTPTPLSVPYVLEKMRPSLEKVE